MRQSEITEVRAEDGALVGVRIGGRWHGHPTPGSLARLTSLPLRFDRYNWQARTITWIYQKGVQS